MAVAAGPKSGGFRLRAGRRGQSATLAECAWRAPAWTGRGPAGATPVPRPGSPPEQLAKWATQAAPAGPGGRRRNSPCGVEELGARRPAEASWAPVRVGQERGPGHGSGLVPRKPGKVCVSCGFTSAYNLTVSVPSSSLPSPGGCLCGSPLGGVATSGPFLLWSGGSLGMVAAHTGVHAYPL